MARVGLVTSQPEREIASLVRDIKDQRDGRVPNLYKVLLHSPKLAEGWLGFFTVVRQRCKLAPEYRELAIMLVGVLNRAEYVCRAHRDEALHSGLSVSQLNSLREWRECRLFNEKQRAMLAYAESMTLLVQVPHSVFGEVRERFDDQEIVELTATVGGYNLVSRFLEALEISPEP